MGLTTKTGARGGMSDAFGIVDVYTRVTASKATFTGGASATALDARCGCQEDEIRVRVGKLVNERTLALRSRHFLHAWEVR